METGLQFGEWRYEPLPLAKAAEKNQEKEPPVKRRRQATKPEDPPPEPAETRSNYAKPLPLIAELEDSATLDEYVDSVQPLADAGSRPRITDPRKSDGFTLKKGCLAEVFEPP